MRGLKRIVLALFILYLIVAALLYTQQRKFLYFPPKIYLAPQAVGLEGIDEIDFNGADWDVTAWYSPPANPDGKIVMVFHGNASAIYSNYDIFRDLIAAGHGVMSVGYPGYPARSESASKPTQTRLVAAAEQQYLYLRAQGHGPQDIIFYGTSLGSGVAAQLSALHRPALLIMDAPFNSVLDMSKKQMPWLPVSLLLKDRFDSGQALRGQNIPLIWIHGTADNIIPISQGQKLYDGYEGPKSAHIIDGGHHTNLWALGGRETVLEAISR